MSLSYELLLIFKEIFPKGRFTHSKEYNKNLLSFMLVNKNWCNSFLPLLWLAPFFDPSGNRVSTINTYLSCLSLEQKQLLYNHGITLPPTSYDQPMYNYPIYLKELQIHTLAKNVIKWCIEYDELYCHDIILRCLLELFSCRGTRIDYFEFGCMEYYSFKYDCWTKYPDILSNINTFNFNNLNEVSIKEMFKDVRHVSLSKDALYLYNFSNTLSKICNKLEYLTADFGGTLWHESSFDHIQCAIDLGILVSCQKKLRNFELVQYKGSTHSCWLDSLKTQKISLSRIYFNEIEFLYQNDDEKLKGLKEFITKIDVLNNKGFNVCNNFQTKTTLLDAAFPKFKHVGFRCGYLEWRNWVKSQHQRQIDKRPRRR